MNRRSILFSILAAILLWAVTGAAHSANDQLRVVASIKPVHSILSGLMKGLREPDLIVAAGRTPYDHEPTAQQLKNLEQADLIVWVGPELEKRLIEPIKTLPTTARVITLLDHPALKVLPSRTDDDARDPFFWLDSRNAIILLDELTRELMALDPGRAHLYRRNRDALFDKIAELDRRLEYGYRGLKGGVVLSYYDTQQYFEQAYALKVGGVLSSAPDVPVSGEKLLQERARLADGGYACLLAEAGMEMPELPFLIDGIEVEMVELDSFGTRQPPGEALYLKLMEHNTRQIKACVQKKAPIEDQAAEEPAESTIREIGGRFLLIDHRGNVVTEKDLLGKYQLIYFGYTYCPDVCPTSLSVMSAALKRLGDKAKLIQPYFITVDPERDSQEVLADYVGYFSKEMIGLTGSRAMIDRIIEAYNLTVERVEEGRDSKNYLIDHTASVFLIAPDGRFITKFAHGITPQQMVEKLDEYVR